jgi:hypothetical protein
MNKPKYTYENIPPLYADDKFYMNMPGIYCKKCGEIFALYFYSNPPDGLDENGKPFYNDCTICTPDKVRRWP